MITTAVVLARGLGTRMRAEGSGVLSEAQRAAASAGYKALMPIGKHRLVDYSLSALADAGMRRVVLVVAPEHDDFRAHIAEVQPKRLDVTFAVQEEPLGTADAVAAAAEAVGDEECIVVNGDNLYPTEGVRALAECGGNSLLGFDRSALLAESNIPAERVAAFALMEESEGKLRHIVEKPEPSVVAAAGEHALVSMNIFAFKPEIFDACRRVEKSKRGEYELVDAVRVLDEVMVVPISAGVLDLSRRDDIAEVERRLEQFEVRL